MTRLKRLVAGTVARLHAPVTVWLAIAALAGFGCAVAGLHGLAGRDWTLLAAGVVVVVGALVVDVD